MFRVILITTSFLACMSAAVPPAFAATVDFETLPVGRRFGAPFGNTPSEIILTQDGIDVSLQLFVLGSFTDFFKAEVGGPQANTGPFGSKPLDLNNISVLFDFAGVGFDVTSVTLDFADFGVAGASNFMVNGFILLDLDALSDVPAFVAPNIQATAIGNLLTFSGPVSQFQIGGQELVIDNITAVPEPTSLALCLFATAAFVRRRRRRTAL